jgi:hypothetical protein
MPIDVPMRFETEQMLWTIEQVYTPSECADLVALIERSSPTLATNNPLYRDQDRVIRDDPEFASDLFRRLRPHLPERMGQLRLIGLNDRLLFYRYRPGQRFEPHMDHWYRPNDRQITLHTVLAYFNDDFEGAIPYSRSSSTEPWFPRQAWSRSFSTSFVTRDARFLRVPSMRCARTSSTGRTKPLDGLANKPLKQTAAPRRER